MGAAFCLASSACTSADMGADLRVIALRLSQDRVWDLQAARVGDVP
jgi:hypothetical protein